MDPHPRKPRSPYSTIIIVAVAGLAATLVVVLVNQIRFAYRNPELRLVLETVEGMIALLTAFLMWGRFRRSSSRADLVLTFGLALLGFSSLGFSVVPDALAVGPRDVLRTWAPVATRFIGGLAFAVAAFLPQGNVGDPRRAMTYVTGAIAGTFGLVVLTTQVFDAALPHVIESELTAEESNRPDLTGNPAFTVIQAGLFLPYAVASVGFLRRFRATGDDLMRWFAAGTVLSAFARIQYALYPSLYSDFFYSGDILRLGFYLLLLVGAVREIRGHWEGMAVARVLEERRRLASDLHDGIAQEMTFLAGQVARLKKAREGAHGDLIPQIDGATSRAIAETRRAISALQGDVHESLDAAIRETALQVFPDGSPRLELSLEPDIVVAPRLRERVVRIVREALTNVARHAEARSVGVKLAREQDSIFVRITDDGRGFDPGAESRGFGITSMRERVSSLGGDFSIDSSPDVGTTVELRVRG